ncbi:MAG: hypothetical protein Q4F31_09890 [Eubacteriales bacterium]|nr:hypothetical protein [Eubacteriales bacterium]
MKKTFALAVALALVLSLGTAAFAEVQVDGEKITDSGTTKTGISVVVNNNEVTASGDPEIVSADGLEGLKSLEVTGSVTATDDNATAVSAQYGSTVEVDGSVTANGENATAVSANTSSQVFVDGSVTSNGNNAGAVFADGDYTKVRVGVSVEANGLAVEAKNGAKVIVGEDVASQSNTGVSASNNSTVTVKGSVSSISATAVYSGRGSEVTVGENATGMWAVQAGNGGKVTVGGDAKGTVNIDSGTMAIIEGALTGDVTNFNSDGELYLGQLTGNITSDKDRVHYLINTDESSTTLDQFSVDGDTDIISTSTIDGVKKEDYYYTTTADTSALSGKTITLKPTDSSKKLKVSGCDNADVNLVTNADGSVSFKLGSNFQGGLQSLMLILENIAKDNPGVAADIIVNADVIASVFVDNSFAVATVKAELPEGAEEGAVTALDIPNHAGIKVAPSLLSKTAEYHMVQMFMDDNPVPEEAYSITNHGDGSVSIQLSNTYLLALGSGTYDFRALVDGQEIFFTVLVAK